MKQIVYKLEGGGIGQLIPNESHRLEDESEEAFAIRIADKTLPRDQPYKIMDNPINLDEEFRTCWVWRGNKNPDLIIDLDKAKASWIEKWRIAREPLLQQLDIEYFKAAESNNEALQTEIALKKQELRDVTKYDLSSVNNVAELKKVWPSTLVR